MEYRVTGTGSYLPLLPEVLAPLNSPQKRCFVVSGVPNGTRHTTEQPFTFSIDLQVVAA